MPFEEPVIDPARRRALAVLVAGVGTSVFGRALVALAAESKAKVTPEMIRQAEWIAGLSFSDDERKLMLDGLGELAEDLRTLRAIPLDNAVPSALGFRPLGEPVGPVPPRAQPVVSEPPSRPATDDDLAFTDVGRLGALLRARQVSSVELTRLYLARLERFDPQLRCVITRTDAIALEQAERADRELAAGRDRGPLHGIPWGAKDLLAVRGYPTTWGAGPYRDQVRDEQSTVATRLEEAGAVLVAKLALGELAWGDVWYDGTTKNPWNTAQGSSGSSAGSAAATAAGLVGFAIGSETWGSIVSPCTRCGVTGLRPTFGRVSRHGAMALAFSMDKLGPIARSVEDCALVFEAIQGPDGLDRSVIERAFHWPAAVDRRTLRVGYAADLFEEDRAAKVEDAAEREAIREWQQHDRDTLGMMRGIGFRTEAIRLPSRHPVAALGLILTAEAATVFDELTRSGRDGALVRQVARAWPNVLRSGQLIPAVEYLRANRVRQLVMQEMEATMSGFDVYVAPTFGGDNLLLTNLTGHPAVVVPNGFRASDGTPTSITFVGRLFGEPELLTVASAFQRATEFHLRRPPVGGSAT